MNMKGLILTGAAWGMLTATAFAEQVELDLWTIDKPGSYSYVFADEYMKANPDVKINVRSVQFTNIVNDLARGIATRSAPDIAYIDNPEIALFASRGMLLDLTPYIEASDVVDLEDIYPGPLAAMTYEDGIYGLPRGANTIALFYNADMFREAGLDPNDPPETWDELYEAAKVLTKPKENIYGLAFAAQASEEATFQFLPWVQMTGGDYDNINTEGAAKALNLWNTFIDEGLASPDTLIRGQWESTGTFNTGSAAMVISGPWELPRMSKEADFDFRATILPVPEVGAKHFSALGEGDNVILASSEHPDEAFKFLEYLHANMDRVWNEFGFLPATNVEVKDPKFPEIYAVFAESMKYARNRGPHAEWPKISEAIQTAIQKTLTEQSSAEDALAQAQAEIDRVLQ